MLFEVPSLWKRVNTSIRIVIEIFESTLKLLAIQNSNNWLMRYKTQRHTINSKSIDDNDNNTPHHEDIVPAVFVPTSTTTTSPSSSILGPNLSNIMIQPYTIMTTTSQISLTPYTTTTTTMSYRHSCCSYTLSFPVTTLPTMIFLICSDHYRQQEI